MAEPRVTNILQASQSFMVIVRDGDVDDRFTVMPTREFYRYLSEIWRLVIKPGNPLSQVEDESADQADQIADNADAIDTNNQSISQINDDLAVITTNLSNLATLTSDHIAATIVHGANGDVVGNLDFATIATGGVVNQAVDVGDPTGTFVNLAAVEAWAAQLRLNLQAAGIMA